MTAAWVQAHMARLPAPISDYVTDTKSVLDQSLRILQAMTDVSADAGWLDTALVTMMLVQSLMQVSPPLPPPHRCCHLFYPCFAVLFAHPLVLLLRGSVSAALLLFVVWPLASAVVCAFAQASGKGH